MTIDCIDAATDTRDVYMDDDVKYALNALGWNGRDVDIADEKFYNLAVIGQFFSKALQQKENTFHVRKGQLRFETYDLTQEEQLFAFALNYPSNQEFVLADPTQHEANIELSRNFLKSAIKKVKKCAKQTAKSVSHFVQEHKKEILIGAVVVGVCVGAYVLAGTLSSSTLGSGAVAAGAAAAAPNQKRREEDQDAPSDDTPSANDPPNPQQTAPIGLQSIVDKETYEKLAHPITALLQSSAPPPPQQELPPGMDTVLGRPTFDRIINPNFTLPAYTLPADFNFKTLPTASEVSKSYGDALASILAHIGKAINSGPLNPISGFLTPNLLPKEPEHIKSCRVQTEGRRLTNVRIGFINGMNTSFKECMDHLYYIKKFAGDMCIEGVYNHSNGVMTDLGEIFSCNFNGIAPGTADLLLENWKQFHEENKNNPDAKYLQIAHSMGTIQTKAALEKAPKEIRDRVIVVAIGPAVVIPKSICYESSHYASVKDIVHWGENLHTLVGNSIYDEPEQRARLEQLVQNKERIILLEKHPDSKDPIDHNLQSPTFKKVLELEINSALKQAKNEN